MSPRLCGAWRGRIAYPRCLAEQRARREVVIRGGEDAFWLLEHPPVLTSGRRAAESPPRQWLKQRDLQVVRTERGGLLTWHGPGQLVGYLMVDLRRRGLGSRRFVEAVEQGLIDWLQERGVSAGRVAGLHGVWSDGAKIASIGLHIRHHVTMHGFSLNLDPDLSVFEGFAACGIVGGRTTSVRERLGSVITPAQASRGVGRAVVAAIQRVCVDT